MLIENVTHHIEEKEQDWFPKVLMHARSSFMEQLPTQQEIIGAEAFLVAMLGLADAEETFQATPGPGLIHGSRAAAKEMKKPPKT